MSVFGCCHNPFAVLSKAAAKAASARLRRVGVVRREINWAARAELCERCPMRTIYRGVSYCGRPLLHRIDRDPASDGCGCPTRDKAKSPAEHCPLDVHHRPARKMKNSCNCKWCELGNESGRWSVASGQ